MKHEIVWTCNFCKNKFKTKEELDKHKAKCIQNPKTGIFPYNNKPRLAWLFLWITAFLSFLVVVVIVTKTPSYQSNHYLDNFLITLFMTNIGVGVFSFLAIFAKHQFKNNQVSIFTKHIFVICLIYFLISFTPFVFANYLGRSQNLKEDYSKYLSISTPTINNFPVEKLELQNVEYNGKVLTGSILNKGDKPAFNTKLSLKISKDRSVWSIEEQHDFIVQYKIEPNQSVKFSENFKTTKNNPWTATAIVEAKYYNGENVPTLIVTPTPKTKTQNTTNTVNTGSQIDCIGPDGKQFKTTMVDCKALNEKWGKTTDYMVNCNISSNCGGGTKNIKNSECNNSTCCQIGDSWIFYLSKDKCNSDQTNYYKGIYTYPTSKPIPTYSYVAPTAPTISNIQPTTKPIPTVDQSAIDARISRCQSGCISSVDSYITSVRNSCRANGGWSSYCQNVVDSRNALISQCQSECY